jgi:hypothetical protein
MNRLLARYCVSGATLSPVMGIEHNLWWQALRIFCYG